MAATEHDHAPPRFYVSNDVTYIDSRRGKKLLKYQEYTYNFTYHNAKMNTKLWRCPGRTRGCKAKIIVDCHDKVVSGTLEHDHPPPKYICVNGMYILL
ncbi:hypothetical protein B5X24_HaOG203951 [Helicoverpa armigera]|uniref:FLYWCH-type domain-containing protein n=1 Tax=Helicoverpa armigera TaxID=29058 RepID=A0A2W1BW34_HELAM|nr:hypothetical protein B5X24_HaOG203951 [Helicoverpa armigera]